MTHNIEWFEDRVGRKVYTEETLCKCATCKNSHIDGILIKTEEYAWDLFWMGQEIFVYRDTPYLALLPEISLSTSLQAISRIGLITTVKPERHIDTQWIFTVYPCRLPSKVISQSIVYLDRED